MSGPVVEALSGQAVGRHPAPTSIDLTDIAISLARQPRVPERRVFPRHRGMVRRHARQYQMSYRAPRLAPAVSDSLSPAT